MTDFEDPCLFVYCLITNKKLTSVIQMIPIASSHMK